MVRSHLNVLLATLLSGSPALAERYAIILTVDAETGSPVPGVSLATTAQHRLVSDDAGIAAFHEPGLMESSIWMSASIDGYELEGADAYGGVNVDTGEDAMTTLRLRRIGAEALPTGDTSQARKVWTGVPASTDYHQVEVVDAETGRGVPMIELQTPNGTFVTDSSGVAAIYHIDLMDTEVSLGIFGHGYAHETGAMRMTLERGGSTTIEVDRALPAERLYRLTGMGIYSASNRLNLSSPLERPLLNAGVIGQDTAMVTAYKGELFWLWGDTKNTGAPMSWNFQVAAATSMRPEDGGLDPELGVDFDYFEDPRTGFVKQMAPRTTIPGPGANWMSALGTVLDDDGEQVLVGSFSRYSSGFTLERKGLAIFDESTERFVELAEAATHEGIPAGQTFHWATDGEDHLYSRTGRVAANLESYRHPYSHQVFTPVLFTGDEVARGERGIEYGWRYLTRAPDEADVDAGVLDASEALFGHFTDAQSGSSPLVSMGKAMAPNPYRDRFVDIVQQSWGSPSFAGEIWFAEADTPMGPWVYGTKIVTHDDYTFYNPRQHPHFAKDGGRRIYFEGTYTAWISSSEETPQYDYNQVMYGLSLDDDRMVLPVPVYDLATAGLEGGLVTKAGLRPDMEDPSFIFFAPDRAGYPGTTGVGWNGPDCEDRRMVTGEHVVGSPQFYAFPPDSHGLPEGTIGLYEYTNGETIRLLPDHGPEVFGLDRASGPVVIAWENPMSVVLPVTDYLALTLADSGPDQCVSVSSAGLVALDGSRSRVQCAGASYSWTWAGGSAEGIRPDVRLEPGLHVVQLQVTEPDGTSSTDELLVSVIAGPETDSGTEPSDGSGCSTVSIARASHRWLPLLLGIWLIAWRRENV